MPQETETMAAFDLGQLQAEAQYIDETPYVVVPNDAKLLDLSHLLPNPPRAKGTTKLGTADSFVAFVVEEATAQTRVYCQLTPPAFTAVINDRDGWKDYKAEYACPLSIEWKTWTGSDGKVMNQADFATFVEKNLLDIVSPPAADMLEISRTLEAKKKVIFASAVRLSTGENQFTYEEEIQGSAAKGQMKVPELFTVGIAVFEGDARYPVDCRLRYRIGEGGKLTMWFELVRPHKIVEDATRIVREKIAAGINATLFIV